MIKFYLKVILKSPIFIISMLFTIFVMLFQIQALNSSIYLYTRINFYAYICFNLFLLLSCTYVMNKNYELEEFFEENIFKKFLLTIITSVIISSLVFIIPIIIITTYTWKDIQYLEFCKGIFNYFILWSLSNCLSATVGCAIGLVVKKWYSYIIAFIIYVGYISHLYGPPKSVFDRLICVFSDNIFIEQNDLAPIIFNLSYYLDKIFIIVFIFIIINTVYFYINEKKNLLKSVVSFFVLIAMLVSIISINNKLSKIGTERYESLSQLDYIIKDYKMDLSVKSNLKNFCEMEVEINKDINSITFMLDNIFKIDSILINNESYNFDHEENKVTIKSDLKKKELAKIKINYTGFVDISNSLGVNTYYVNNKYINIPDKRFYWYPKVNNNTICDFDVKLKSNSIIYSNLDIKDRKEHNGNYEYKLNGNDNGFSIFAGEYKVINDKNIQYIIPKSYDIELTKQYLDDLSNNIIKESSSIEANFKSEILKKKLYKKVIVCDWYFNSKENELENEIQFFKDTIIINLGV